MNSTIAVVIEMIEGSDLITHEFQSIEEAMEYIENTEWKCILVTGHSLAVSDHT